MIKLTYKRSSFGEYISDSPTDFLNQLTKGRKSILGFSGRTVLYDVFATLKVPPNSSVLLPAFYPEGIKLPVERLGCEIITYALNDDFSPDLSSVEQKIKEHNVKLCFLIHYFGHCYDFRQVIKILEQNNVFVIEDCAQALFKYINSDYYNKSIILYSFPKFLSVTDGALAVFNLNVKYDLNKNHLNSKKDILLSRFSAAMHLLSLYLRKLQRYSDKTVLYRCYSHLASVFYILYYRSLCMLSTSVPISKQTYEYLLHFEFVKFISLREKNYETIKSALGVAVNIKLNTYAPNYLGYVIKLEPDVRELVGKRLKQKLIDLLYYNHGWYYHNPNSTEATDLSKSFLIIPVNEHVEPETINKAVKEFTILASSANATISQF